MAVVNVPSHTNFDSVTDPIAIALTIKCISCLALNFGVIHSSQLISYVYYLQLCRMQKLAKELGVVIPVSFFEEANNAHYNSIAIIDADGTDLGLYRKSHIPDGPGMLYPEQFIFTRIVILYLTVTASYCFQVTRKSFTSIQVILASR